MPAGSRASPPLSRRPSPVGSSGGHICAVGLPNAGPTEAVSSGPALLPRSCFRPAAVRGKHVNSEGGWANQRAQFSLSIRWHAMTSASRAVSTPAIACRSPSRYFSRSSAMIGQLHVRKVSSSIAKPRDNSSSRRMRVRRARGRSWVWWDKKLPAGWKAPGADGTGRSGEGGPTRRR